MSTQPDQQPTSSIVLPTREKANPPPPDTSQNALDGSLKSLPPTSNGSITPALAPVGKTKTQDQFRPPPLAKKPTMTSRISGIFKRDTGDGLKDSRDKPSDTKKDAPVQQQANGKISSPPAPASSAASTASSKQPGSPPNGLVEKSMVRKPPSDEHGMPKRFWMNEDGTHEHYLKVAKRHQKLKDLMRSWFDRKKQGTHEEQPLALMNDWVTMQKSEAKATADLNGGPSQSQSLVEKYGKCQEIVGHGAFGIVRVAHKVDPRDSRKEQLFAVKEFHRRPSESAKKYQKRLTSEFCISSSMQHPNVIQTLDLLQDDKGDYCEVMQYCAGGDLYTLILAAGNLEPIEADCYFKQLMRGVEYMHEMGVAHRDLKPENLLLSSRGALKITDFGNGECFRMAWEKEAHMTAGLCGSAPYIAPEEYVDKEFDPRAVDVWACGVIYMAMRTGRHLWRVAQKGEDEFFTKYLEDRKEESGFRPIEVLRRVSYNS
jgi:protein-serine/threonine kinase